MRLTTVLCRIPVIKFRKGGINPSGGGNAPGSCPATKGPAAAPTSQPAAAMSTSGAIPDIDLPARYRRQPLSEEEIAHINGGGIKDPSETTKQPALPKTLGTIQLPCGVLIEPGKKSKDLITLNIMLVKEKKLK